MEEGRGTVVPAPVAYEVYESVDEPGLHVVVSHWPEGVDPVPLLPGARSWRFRRASDGLLG